VLERLTRYVPSQLPLTSSLLVVRHGYLVYERYFLGPPQSLRHVWSVTKSVLSVLTGLALAEGRLASLEQPMLDFFPEYDPAALDPAARRITLRHLLTMSDGIARDGLDFVLEQGQLAGPLRHEPGTSFYYNSLSPQVLSIIIGRATGASARQYARERLFAPLGIREVAWAEAQGQSLGAFGLKMTSRDLAKIGWLFLNGGRWEGRQLLPAEWVRESTRAQVRAPRSEEFRALTGRFFLDRYGYYWWVRPDHDPPAYLAQGFGGQFLYIVPGLDLLVVITTEDRDRRENLHALGYLALVADFIVPAVR